MGRIVKNRILIVSATAAALAAAPHQAAAQASPYIGQIQWFGYNFCPKNWAPAQGQLLPIAQNTALFSILGTTYGGDGRSTFGLPDLSGRMTIAAGAAPGLSNYALGQKSGVTTTTLSLPQMPAHSHSGTLTATLRAVATNGNSADPTGRVLAAGQRVYHAPPTTVTMHPSSVQATATLSPVGGGQSFDDRQPYLGMIACVALVGTFPPRS